MQPPPFRRWPEPGPPYWPDAEPPYYEPNPHQWQQHPQHHWNPPHAPHQHPQPLSTGYDQPDRYPHIQGPGYPQRLHREHCDEGRQWGVRQQEDWYPPDPFHEDSCHGNQNPRHGGTDVSIFESGEASQDLSGPHWVSFDDSGQGTSFDFQTHQDRPKVISTACAHIPPSTGDLQHCDSTERRATSEGGVARVDYKDSFLAQVQKFVVKNSDAFDFLVKGTTPPELVPTLHDTHSEESFKYAEPDALEYHMQVTSVVRRKRFFELVITGDIVRGHVVAKSPGGLTVQVTSFVKSHKMRELSDLEIKGLVSLDNLTVRLDKKEEVMDEMQLDDVVQAVVMGVEKETLSLSFRGDHLPIPMLDTHLGYMEGKRPVRSRGSDVGKEDFLLHLEQDPGFTNPHCVENLMSVLGIRSSLQPTLLRDIQLARYPESDFADALRKAQRGKWSMETVATGVRYFKAGEYSKAMKFFDHALDIDSANVEGLVARGALFANSDKFKQAIADFEAALTLKRTHRNARKYLVETQVAYGQELEKLGDIDRAMRCYREALADSPEEETARTRLGILTAAAEKKAAEQREIERKKLEEKATLKKLHRIIEKEKKKKKKTGHKKKKKTAKTSVSKKQKKKTRRQSRKDYSSDESTASASSYYSDSSRTLSPESPEVGRKHRKYVRSRSRSSSPSPSTVRRKRRVASQTPSPDRHSRKVHRKRRSESDRHRSMSRSSSATPRPTRNKATRGSSPLPESSKSKRRRRKYSDRSEPSSDESRSRSRSRSRSPPSKKVVSIGSDSPVSSRRHRKRRSDSTSHSQKDNSSSGHSKPKLKKHSHNK